MTTPEQILEWIAGESDAFAATISADTVDRRVPGCPDWSLRELVWHLGRVQKFWAADIRAGVDEQPDFRENEPGPDDPAELEAFMRASTAELLAAIRTTPADTPAWTWWKEPRDAGAIARHQSQEAALHRWDAQSASGTPEPIDPALAIDALDEFVRNARQLRDAAPVVFVATDAGRSFSFDDGTPAVTVSGSAADLLLLAYGRLAPSDVKIEGDQTVLEGFLAPID